MKKNEETESILLWSRQTITSKLISRKSLGSVKSCGKKKYTAGWNDGAPGDGAGLLTDWVIRET